jgi:hypothetical protein
MTKVPRGKKALAPAGFVPQLTVRSFPILSLPLHDRMFA